MTVDEGAARWTPRADRPPTGDPEDGKPEGVYARRTRIRKQEILDSAVVAFGQKGFYKATLADVASAAGITAAGLLHHFKTKEALLVELLEQRDLLGLQEATGGELPRGQELLQHLVDTMARNMTRPVTTQMYAVLSVEGATDAHPARSWFLDRYQRLRALIATAIFDGARDGDFEAPADVEATARAIVAVMDGLQIQWLYEPDSVDMSEVTCRVINALVRPAVPLVSRTPATPPPPA
jgi:AcrR family transcriptional regulator